MNYQEKCDCCGSIIAAYTHNINKPMVAAFVKLVNEYFKTRQPVNINQDIEINHNQKCNLPKLQYFGMIKRIEDGWIPTVFGIEFYHGRNYVMTPVATLKNKVIGIEHEAWRTHKTPQKRVNIDDFIEYEYKKRPEYQAEKSMQQTMI